MLEKIVQLNTGSVQKSETKKMNKGVQRHRNTLIKFTVVFVITIISIIKEVMKNKISIAVSIIKIKIEIIKQLIYTIFYYKKLSKSNRNRKLFRDVVAVYLNFYFFFTSTVISYSVTNSTVKTSIIPTISRVLTCLFFSLLCNLEMVRLVKYNFSNF